MTIELSNSSKTIRNQINLAIEKMCDILGAKPPKELTTYEGFIEIKALISWGFENVTYQVAGEFLLELLESEETSILTFKINRPLENFHVNLECDLTNAKSLHLAILTLNQHHANEAYSDQVVSLIDLLTAWYYKLQIITLNYGDSYLTTLIKNIDNA